MRPRSTSRFILFASVFVAGNAFAACTASPPFLPYHYRVGADTAHCQYNDIQSAIDAVGDCPTVIDITREHLYTHQHLAIADKPNLTLQGWGDGVTCADVRGPIDFPPYAPPDTTAPLVTLNGNGDNGSVLYVTGNTNLAIRNLTVSGGYNVGTDDNNSVGGGIHFDGQGSLYITRSTVSFNEAGFGGGIDMSGSSGPATLTLDSDTLVLSNTADTSGGGIRMRGNARLYALKPNTMIAFNKAPYGYGGGMEVLGPARADIGSPGYGGLGVIYDNSAAYGGGIDILTFDDDATALVNLFTTDPANPVRIQSNTASHTGGAVYLKPHLSFTGEGFADFCASDFRIDDNAAAEGAAIYSDSDYNTAQGSWGGYVELHGGTNNACGAAPADLGAVTCAANTHCNRIEGNVADDNGTATDGSTILVQDSGLFIADRVELRANAGGHVMRNVGGSLEFSNTLIAGNTVTQELVAQTDTGNDASWLVQLNSTTIAGNSIGASHVVYAVDGTLQLFDSIVDQPGLATVDPAITDGAQVAHVLSNDRSTLPDTTYIEQGEPTFVDAANGDYHLTPASLGVDDAPAADGSDLDDKPRVVDLPNVTNNFGPMDLGAYEVQLSAVLSCAVDDTVFCDGFETP